jgi:hypothetical protein
MDVIAGKYPRQGDELFVSEDLISLWEDEDARNNNFMSESRLGSLKPLTNEQLAEVQTCGMFRSFLQFLSRAFTQQMRASSQMMYDLLLEAFAGTLVGCLYLNIQFVDLTK